MAIDPAIIALAGTVFGGVGLKLVENWLGRSRVRIDDAAQIRNELRLEVEALRKENSTLEGDVDKWRESYYNLREQAMKKDAELIVALDKVDKDKFFKPPKD